MAACLAALALAAASAAPVARAGAGFDEYLGIRYGEAPIGDRRFAPSTLAPMVGAPDKHGQFGRFCMQPVPPQYWPYIDEIMSEDCLYINVHTPAGAAGSSSRLPVLLYIHGGGYTGGAGSFYNGSVLASRHDVVVATINYRLGSLGFLSLPELRQYNTTGGLNGIGDQITALTWVQQHIAQFGGDPDTVTLFGESAGAGSICNLLVSPKAKGLFKRAIMESGPCNGPWAPSTQQEALAGSAQFAEYISGGHPSLQSLRQVGAYKMVNTTPAGGLFGFAMPAPDDLILTQMPIESYKMGTMNSDEVILGGNSFDGLVPFELPPGQLNESDFAAATAQWPAEMKEIYPLSRFGGNTNAPLAMSDGDCCVVCAGYELARLMTNAGARVHTFYYDYGPVCGDEAITKQLTTPSSGWASHASEIPWVFGTDDICFRNASEIGLTDAMQELWSSFGRTGIPQSGGLSWPPHTGDLEAGQTMILDLQPRVESGVKARDCKTMLEVAKCGTPPPPPPPPPGPGAAEPNGAWGHVHARRLVNGF